MEIVHTPVLLEETISYLAPRAEGELMVDGTQGEGGHSEAFLTRFESLKVIGIDADSSIQAIAKERLARFGDRVHFYNGWSHDFFAEYPSTLKRPDTILFDLGISMFHYEKAGRGFSFRKDEALDMRIDSSSGPSAADLVNTMGEEELANLIYNYAEERYSRRIAKAIVVARSRSRLETTFALKDVVERAVPGAYRHLRIHPATRTFQALRIAVNGELSRLRDLLESSMRILEVGGRMGVITFHSLEDRIVKDFFKTKAKTCTCPETAPICTCGRKKSVDILTRKAVGPTEREAQENPPSRSAKLRVAQKLLDEDGAL